jgi:eukaryotic-like serine/threonine-protein kinase
MAAERKAALLAGSRYELLVKIATGGQATVYVGRLSGSRGFQRLVAVKRAHPHLREDEAARTMLVREARLASRLHHANVVVIHDVEETDDELLLVMDYVEGGSLAELCEREAAAGGALPPPVAMRILLDTCAGLAAVHELADDDGRPLGFVHRDVSPQNILVGIDGTARVGDFGLAKGLETSASATAAVRGKIAYLAPEHVDGGPYTQRCDLFSLAVVAWEALTGRRLFRGHSDADTLRKLVLEEAPLASTVAPSLGAATDRVLARALAKRPEDRTTSVAAFARELHDAGLGVATHADVGRAVERLLGDRLQSRRQALRAILDPEGATTGSVALADLPLPPEGEPSYVPEVSAEIEATTRKHAAKRRRPSRWPLVVVAVVAAGGAAGAWLATRADETTPSPSAAPAAATAAPPRASEATSTSSSPSATPIHLDVDLSAEPTAVRGAPKPSASASASPLPDNPYRKPRPPQ